mmetsp:Transcript_1796/g.3253  ORF Transcript_1796/g.3253 Transcript_1796/m.3253 type:complete len:165 (-) Transcript_1796:623-1117(-)
MAASNFRELDAIIVVLTEEEAVLSPEESWSPGHAERLVMFATIMQREILSRYGAHWPISKQGASDRSRIDLRINRNGSCGPDGYILEVKNDLPDGLLHISLTAGSERAMLTAIYRFIRDLRIAKRRIFFPADARRISVSAVSSARQWSRERLQRGTPVPPPLVL